MNVRCIANKQIFSNWESNYRVLSFYPVGNYYAFEVAATCECPITNGCYALRDGYVPKSNAITES